MIDGVHQKDKMTIPAPNEVTNSLDGVNIIINFSMYQELDE